MTRHFLIVDDDVDVRDMLCDFLEGQGYGVQRAATLSGAAAALEGGDIDLMIVDIRLPDGNGVSLADAARAKGVPAILLTGHPDVLLQLGELQHPHLAKPFRLTELEALVEGCLCLSEERR